MSVHRGLVAVWSPVKRLALWSFEHRMLAVGQIAVIALIFLPDGEWLSRFLALPFLFLMASLGLISPGRPYLTYSHILVACGLYLLALLVASIAGPDASWIDIWRQFRISLLILMFLAATGSLVAAFPNFPLWLCLGAGTVAAIMAAINIYLFFEYLVPAEFTDVSVVRLIAMVGMPAYANSTNISATYAVMFAALAATMLTRNLRSWQRALLGADAALLLAGILLTQARSAFLAVLISLTVLALTAGRRLRYALLATLSAVCLLSLAMPVVRDAILERGSSFRFDVWSKFYSLILERPWIGYGPFSPVAITVGDGYVLDQAHNLVLSAWLRGGIVGAAAMAAILCGGIFWSRRYWKLTGDALPLCVVTAVFAAGMFDYQLMATYPTWPWPTFWLPFGLAIGAEMALRARDLGRAEVSGQGSPEPHRPDLGLAHVEAGLR